MYAHGFLCLLGVEGKIVRDTVFYLFFIFNRLYQSCVGPIMFLSHSAEFRRRFSLPFPRLLLSLKNFKSETDAHMTLPGSQFTCPLAPAQLLDICATDSVDKC